MPRSGRPSPEKETRIKQTILQLVPVDPPGIRFSDLVELCKRQGISRPAVWRHLEKFVSIGAVIHEARPSPYRRNPLYNNPLAKQRGLIELQKEKHPLDVWAPAWAYYLRIGEREGKEAPAPTIAKVNLQRARETTARTLHELLNIVMASMLHNYLALLQSLVKCEDLATAREVANLMPSANDLPMLIARQVWEARRIAKLPDLEGQKFAFEVSRSSTGTLIVS
ncbi:MAG TPA: hypothetical protein VLV18_11140 [Terriglobales bacterium]|nr:hypothetical protein [Terriglobales bacterium]